MFFLYRHAQHQAGACEGEERYSFLQKVRRQLFSSSDDEDASDDSSDDESVSTLARRVREEMTGARKSGKKSEKSTKKVRRKQIGLKTNQKFLL
jgi:hypothetical protein